MAGEEEIAAGLTTAQKRMLPTIEVRQFPPLGRAIMWTVGSHATCKKLEAKGLVDGNGLTDLGRRVAALVESQQRA